VIKVELRELATVCEEVASNIEDHLTGGWVLLLAAYGHASGPNELAWRRPRYGCTQDDVRSARRSLSCGPEFLEQCYVFRIPTHGRCYTPTGNYELVGTRIARSIPARHSWAAANRKSRRRDT
jgi:hypothetical protein